MKVRIKFSADLVIEGTTLKDIRNRWESIPLFSKEAQDCGVQYSETLLIENANTYDDLSREW